MGDVPASSLGEPAWLADALRLLGRCLLASTVMVSAATAGELDRETLARYFPPPYEVAARQSDLPVWPLLIRNGPYLEQAGYAFESIDLAPLPGFAGVPVNLLIAIDLEGRFVEARVLSHHEPVFLDGLGPEPLHQFVRQYRGLSLHHNVKVTTSIASARRADSTSTYVDGVSKATASARIVNDSLLNAALEVARARLGVGRGAAQPPGRIRADTFEELGWAELIASGRVQRFVLRNRELDQAFAGSDGEGLDEVAREHPDTPFVELYAAYLNLPSVRRALYGEAQSARIMAALEPGDMALWLASSGRYSFIGEDFVRHTVPDHLGLRQAGFPIGLRDMDRDEHMLAQGLPPFDTVMIFRVLSETGVDPALPLELVLRVTRFKGYIYPQEISRDFSFRYALPARLVEVAEPTDALGGWRALWYERRFDLSVLGVALCVLLCVLAWPRTLARRAHHLARFRLFWLVFVLFFIGWYAQGQLSIVNLTGILQALARGSDLAYLLQDPVSLTLWLFVLPSLLLWGRGTFCGWLCPFGALQELGARLGTRLGIRGRSLPATAERALLRFKYVVLGVLLASAWLSPSLGARLVEVEPFKTSITLVFVRSWPFVAYAIALLLIGLWYYKAFCRYLCPLGAALAVFGRLRLWAWIPRREACGSRCQLCRRACEYGAIRADGGIDYDECFQCLDCVGIYHDRGRCAPLLLEDRKGIVLVGTPQASSARRATQAIN